MAGLGISLAGCASVPDPRIATLSNGACKAFTRPQYALKGVTEYDQAWADDYIETGVGACGWKRPEPRPKSWDKPKVVTPAPAAIKPKKKPGFLRRLVS